MASKIEILNSALIKLGAGRILSEADDNKRTRVIVGQYGVTRDALLRSYLWSFAMKRASLPSLAGAPTFGYTKAFALPGDFLRLAYLGDTFVGPSMSDYRNSDESMYAIEGQAIVCDEPAPLHIRYVARIENTNVYDPLFVQALACHLAIDCCEEITQSGTKKESIREDLKTAMRDAVRVNAVEKPPQPLPDDSWMLGRLGPGS
jgi:hypothetical protein